MDVFLVHGMGRTRGSLVLLAARLRRHGHRVHFIDYVAAFDPLAQVTRRLVAAVGARQPGTPYALLGHSLGTVIIRGSLAALAADPPAAVCFLAPPIRACRAAKYFSRFRLYRWCTGEMGLLLADERFMDHLPMPARTRIYAGTAGPRRGWLPFGDQLNDGILLLEEMDGRGAAELRVVPKLHTWIMYSRAIADELLAWLAEPADPRTTDRGITGHPDGTSRSMDAGTVGADP